MSQFFIDKVRPSASKTKEHLDRVAEDEARSEQFRLYELKQLELIEAAKLAKLNKPKPKLTLAEQMSRMSLFGGTRRMRIKSRIHRRGRRTHRRGRRN